MLPPLIHHIILTLLAGLFGFAVVAGIGTVVWWSRLDRATQDLVWRSRQKSAAPKARAVDLYKTLRGAWSDDLVLYVFVLTAGVGAVVAIVLNLNLALALGIIVGGAVGAMFIAARKAAVMTANAFEKQLLTGLTLLATQLKAGMGMRRAVERVAAVVDDPLQRELNWVLSQVSLQVPIHEAFRMLANKYPLPAMRNFVVALDVDQATSGSRLAPVLDSIAASLDEEFRLRSEADSEIAQSKYEFNAIIGIVGLMWVGAFFTDVFREAILSPIGLILSGVAFVNAAAGVWRARRLFAYASGKRRIQ